MFYAQYVLLKKGPLARIWLAAHWEKKLTKAQIYETDIAKAVDFILEPKVRMALRTTGHLLLGVVKIYYRKAKYLLADCNETCTRMRLAFRPYAVVVDLPEDNVVAPFDAITYPEVFHDFDSAGMDVSLNQSRYEDITMIENMALPINEIYNTENAYGFGDDEEIEARRGASTGQPSWNDLNNLRESIVGRRMSSLEGNISGNPIDLGQYVGDEPMDLGLQQPGATVVESALPSSSPVRNDPVTPVAVPMSPIVGGQPGSTAPRSSDVHGMTTLLSNAADGFILAPLDDATLGASRQRGLSRKRRRCLMVDAEKSILPEVMKERIANYKDTTRPLDLAPETKRKMYVKERDAVTRLLTFPGLDIGSTLLSEVYQPNLKTRVRVDEADEVGPGITLVDDIQPIPLEPIIEDVEMERNYDHADPAVPAVEHAERSAVYPVLPTIPEEVGETPQGNENEAPLPLLGQAVPFSPYITEIVREEGDRSERILSERNSSTPIPVPSSPRKTPNKEKRNQSLPLAEAAVYDLNSSGTSRSSTSWDVKAQNILTKLKERVINEVFNSADSAPRIPFSSMVDGRDTRKSVARKFYAILELKKSGAINVEQAEPYSEIIVSTGPAFYDNVNF